MSGIAGVVALDGGPADIRLVRRMTTLMAHRGPDGINHWCEGSAALGQCLMHTTPESLEESQPLCNEDQSVILVMDGRIDNWSELRAELLQHGARLRNRSDSELVLRAFEIWGTECLSHVDGDFAFLTWQPRRREIFCARDRVGMKPFHYRFDGRVFSFASEISALRDLPHARWTFNEGLLAEFLLADWFSVDETFWVEVKKLPPGTAMRVTDRGHSLTRYWAPKPSRVASRNLDDWAQEYKALLNQSVRQQSRSHKPIAFEVSGGLDSSALFAVADRALRSRELLAPDLAGFTLRFDDGSEADEIDYAQAVGAFLDRKIHEIPPTKMPLNWYQDRSFAEARIAGLPNGVMGMGIRERVAASGMRSLIIGIGGDEVLCGSKSYYTELLISGHVRKLLHHVWLDVTQAGYAHAGRLLFRYSIYPLLPRPVRKEIRRIAEARGLVDRMIAPSWVSTELKLCHEARLAARSIDRDPDAVHDLVARVQPSYNVWARETEEERAARVGIELRAPYLSRTLIEFFLDVPGEFLSRGGYEKVLHRRAMEGLLPPKVLNRIDKAEFSSVYSGYAAEVVAQLRDPQFRQACASWVDVKTLDRQLAQSELETFMVDNFAMWTLINCVAMVE